MAVFAVIRASVVATLAMSVGAARLARSQNALEQRANPIRRVVELLKAMQVKVTEEGKAEEELYAKFSCYCKTGKGDLGSAIAMAEDKMPKVTAAIEEAKSKKAQTDSDVSKAKADRAEGKEALATAKALRAKEAAAYGKLSSDFQTDLSALTAAIAAIEKGMSAASSKRRRRARSVAWRWTWTCPLSTATCSLPSSRRRRGTPRRAGKSWAS